MLAPPLPQGRVVTARPVDELDQLGVRGAAPCRLGVQARRDDAPELVEGRRVGAVAPPGFASG